MSVAQYIEDCKKDLANRGKIYPRNMAQFKNMVCNMDELLDSDKTSTHKFKKSVKGLHNASLSYVTNEISYAENMERLGSIALSREAETGIGTAFLKLSVINKELASHRKVMCESFNNMVLFPLNSLLKGDMNKIGDMRRPFEESWKDFKSKGMKKDARKKTSEIVLYRVDPPADLSENSDRERRMFMYSTCEYLTKANEVKVKKGVELVQHLIEYYHAQLRYFNSGMELLENMRSYFEGLAGELQQLKTEKDDERKELTDIKNQLKMLLQLEVKEGDKNKCVQNYKIHGQQGDKVYGGEKSGTLMKRSEGVRKQWQKRFCVIKDGQFTLAHSQQSAPTTTLNLLTCQVKPSPEKEKKFSFALVAHNRTYLFQAEDELDFDVWISVLSNAREEALNKAFGSGEGALSTEPVSSIGELTQGIISEVKRLPGNNQCVDCNAFDPTWLSSNLGVLVCIECSGIHRDLGVHVSRIRSLTLDRLGTAELLLARAVGNSGFNEIMEADLDPALKPHSTSKMEVRKEFIQHKYIQKKFIHSSGNPSNVLIEELKKAINYHDILAILQLHADGVDFTLPIPETNDNGSALHYCIEREDLSMLHVVDFIIQNFKNLNVQNAQGNTALHLTALYNSSECTKLLLRGGAKIDITNKESKTALTIAQDKKYTEVVELLQDAMDGKTAKCDHVKIDWGIQETENIYATPVDISELRLELKGELEKALPVTSPAANPGPIQRVQSVPKGNMKTTGHPTPATVLTASSSVRHSVAISTGISLPPPLPEKQSHIHCPPLPPVRKPGKPKAVSTSVNSTSTPTNEAGNTPLLSTFAPRPVPISNVVSPLLQVASDKSLGPPTPPTRTSSFIPRGSAGDPSLPRPDRPPPPTPHKRGHSRNVSEGNILYNTPDVNNSRNRTNSVADVLINCPVEMLKDIVPPPLPPPRPKTRNDLPLLPSPNEIVTSNNKVKRSATLPKGKESKVRFRRAKALYDCDADHGDELSFVEGDIIIMKKEADPDWWYGEVEGCPERNGVFPISFVHVLND